MLRLVPTELFATTMGAETRVTPFTLGAASFPVPDHEDDVLSEQRLQPIAFETCALWLTASSSKTVNASVHLYPTRSRRTPLGTCRIRA